MQIYWTHGFGRRKKRSRALKLPEFGMVLTAQNTVQAGGTYDNVSVKSARVADAYYQSL
jgi:hypothetical protein